MLVEAGHRHVAELGPRVDLAQAVAGGPVQGESFQVRCDTTAAPVPTYGGQGVLGALGYVVVEHQAGAADHLVIDQCEEHGVAAPRGRPLLGADLQRRVHREVGEGLGAEPLVAPLPELGTLGQRDDLDPVRQRRGRLFVADDAGLLDLAVHLDEPEALGERERAVVVDLGVERRQAQPLAVLGQPPQERRPYSPTPMLLEDPRRDEAADRPRPTRPPGRSRRPCRRCRASTSSRLGVSCFRSSATEWQRSPGSTAIRTARHASRSASVTHAVMSMPQG